MTRSIPNAVRQDPLCGCCSGEMYLYGDVFICEDCQLQFDPDTLEASYLDQDAGPCGDPCTNHWHGPSQIKLGYEFVCAPCALPAGHDDRAGAPHHWRPCDMVPVAITEEKTR